MATFYSWHRLFGSDCNLKCIFMHLFSLPLILHPQHSLQATSDNAPAAFYAAYLWYFFRCASTPFECRSQPNSENVLFFVCRVFSTLTQHRRLSETMRLLRSQFHIKYLNHERNTSTLCSSSNEDNFSECVDSYFFCATVAGAMAKEICCGIYVLWMLVCVFEGRETFFL